LASCVLHAGEMLDDVEGERLPAALPPVADAHVHLFPDRLFAAVRQWFDSYGWRVRYRMESLEVIEFLLGRGVGHIVALQYAHKPGIARALNRYMVELCAASPRIVGAATVFPGEAGAVEILEEAFADGLALVKMHCHVQCIAPDAPEMQEVHAACARAGRPLVIHAGRGPRSPHYRCDTDAVCGASRVARVLEDHPRLKLVVPHLGYDEVDEYARLLERYDNLWLDTTMAAADYFPIPYPSRILRARPDRIMYGTDFPNIPYAWDREIKKLAALDLPECDLAMILGGTARALYGIDSANRPEPREETP
jgi:predicted TIM-barrel fold metal-dependent hydrolase